MARNEPDETQRISAPAPEPEAAAPEPAEAPAAPAQSFTVGQAVKLPPRNDDAGEDEPERLGIVVGVSPASPETPEIYDVAELPASTARFFGSDLQPA